jgi:hypothetical protein
MWMGNGSIELSDSACNSRESSEVLEFLLHESGACALPKQSFRIQAGRPVGSQALSAKESNMLVSAQSTDTPGGTKMLDDTPDISEHCRAKLLRIVALDCGGAPTTFTSLYVNPSSPCCCGPHLSRSQTAAAPRTCALTQSAASKAAPHAMAGSSDKAAGGKTARNPTSQAMEALFSPPKALHHAESGDSLATPKPPLHPGTVSAVKGGTKLLYLLPLIRGIT